MTGRSWLTLWSYKGKTVHLRCDTFQSLLLAGLLRSASTESRGPNGRNNYSRGGTLSPRTRDRTHLPKVRSTCSKGLGSARCPQSHQRQNRHVPLVSVVLPNGSLWKLRHDGKRRAQTDLCNVPDGLRPGPSAG